MKRPFRVGTCGTTVLLLVAAWVTGYSAGGETGSGELAATRRLDLQRALDAKAHALRQADIQTEKLHDQVHEASDHLKDAEKAIQQTLDELTMREAELDALSSNLETTLTYKEDLEQQLESLGSKLNEANDRLASAVQETEQLGGSLNETLDRAQSAESDVAACRHQVTSLAVENTRLQTRLTTAERSITQLETTVATLERSLQNCTDEGLELQSQLNKSAHDLALAKKVQDSQRAEHSAKLREATDRERKATKELAAKASRISSLEQSLSNRTKEYREAQIAKDAMTAEVEQLERQAENADTLIQDLQSKNMALDARVEQYLRPRTMLDLLQDMWSLAATDVCNASLILHRTLEAMKGHSQRWLSETFVRHAPPAIQHQLSVFLEHVAHGASVIWTYLSNSAQPVSIQLQNLRPKVNAQLEEFWPMVNDCLAHAGEWATTHVDKLVELSKFVGISREEAHLLAKVSFGSMLVLWFIPIAIQLLVRGLGALLWFASILPFRCAARISRQLYRAASLDGSMFVWKKHGKAK